MPVQTSHPISFIYSGIDHSYELQENAMQDGLPSFQFRKRNGEINWRKLSALDVDRVARELDFITLQENIATVTFCNIDTVSDVDPLIGKLFKMAQFTIEYLLHSQEYLQSIVNECEVKIEEGSKSNEVLQTKVDELNDQIVKLKDENKKRRKMIQQQQMLIEAGANSYYQCPYCEKAFMNVSFLQGHLQRRHPGSISYIGDVIAHSQKEQTRLGAHMKLMEDELKNEREAFNQKLLKAEEDKKQWTKESKRLMDEWKAAEEARMKEQMESMRASFLEDIDKLKKKEETYQEKIADLQQTMDIRHSNLGELVDDLEEEKQKLRQYEDRVMSLEELNSAKNKQIDNLTKSLQKLRHDSSFRDEHDGRLVRQERRMRELESKLSSSVPKPQRLRKQVEEASEEESDSMSIHDVSYTDEINAMKPEIRRHLISLLNEKLKSAGVDPEASRISTAVLTRKLMVLKAERKQTAEQVPDFYQIRENSRRDMTIEAKKKFQSSQMSLKSESQLGSDKTESYFHQSPSDVTMSGYKAPSSSQKFHYDSRDSQMPQQSIGPQRSPTRSSGPPRHKKPKGGSLPPSVASTPRASARKQATRLSPSPTGRKQSSRPSPTLSGRKEATPSPTPVPRSAQPKARSPQTSDDNDVSDWDDVDDLLTDDDGPNKVTMVQPNVKNLTKKLESNLSSRKKPPVGAVDVAPQVETKVEEFHLSADEDDSFLVSSLEEEKKDRRPSSSRAPTGGFRKSAASSSSNTFGTSVWGSGQRQSKSMLHDDFDSDDDLDIDELMT